MFDIIGGVACQEKKCFLNGLKITKFPKAMQEEGGGNASPCSDPRFSKLVNNLTIVEQA